MVLIYDNGARRMGVCTGTDEDLSTKDVASSSAGTINDSVVSASIGTGVDGVKVGAVLVYFYTDLVSLATVIVRLCGLLLVELVF